MHGCCGGSGFCSRRAVLNSGLTEGFSLLLYSVFLSFHSLLIMEESYSKGAYLNLYNSRTPWFVLLSKFPFSPHLCLSFLLSLLPPTSILLSLLRKWWQFRLTTVKYFMSVCVCVSVCMCVVVVVRIWSIPLTQTVQTHLSSIHSQAIISHFLITQRDWKDVYVYFYPFKSIIN